MADQLDPDAEYTCEGMPARGDRAKAGVHHNLVAAQSFVAKRNKRSSVPTTFYGINNSSIKPFKTGLPHLTSYTVKTASTASRLHGNLGQPMSNILTVLKS